MQAQDEPYSILKTEVLENDSKIHQNISIENPYTCETCNITYISRNEFTKHMEEHVKTELPYVIDDFEAYEVNVNEIKIECLTDGVYTDTQLEVYICDICNIKYANKIDLEKHVIDSHRNGFMQSIPTLKNNNKSKSKKTDKKSPYTCSICKKTYKTKCGLLKHLHNFKHGQKFACTICNFKCITENNLAEHKKVHLEEILKIFTCKKCNKRFLSREILNKHKKTQCQLKTNEDKISNSDERQLKCEECDKRFPTENKLIEHYKTHTELKPWACSVCDYKSKCRHNLLRHERRHTGEKPYKCSTCGHSCSDKTSLKYHMRTHTGEKPYKCSVCNKKFATSSDLAVHRKIHTGDKKFSCNLCSYKSIKGRDLRYHKKRVHFIEN